MTPLSGIPMSSPRVSAEVQTNEDYAHLQEDAPLVEHLTIPGFLRRISHRWTLDDIARFGNKVGRAAESCHLAYMPQVDGSLGVLRSFPVPMLRRIYDLMAPSHRWPQLPEMLELDRPGKSEPVPTTPAHQLRLMQAFANIARSWAAEAPESETRVAARVILLVIEAECRALERELELTQVKQMTEPGK
jgi:hypothetical protein